MTKAGTPRLNVAMVGHGFMGAAHSQAWRVAPRFFDLPLTPWMSTIVGRNAAGVAAAAKKWGWASAETNWRSVVERDDIDLILSLIHISEPTRLGMISYAVF